MNCGWRPGKQKVINAALSVACEKFHAAGSTPVRASGISNFPGTKAEYHFVIFLFCHPGFAFLACLLDGKLSFRRFDREFWFIPFSLSSFTNDGLVGVLSRFDPWQGFWAVP
jgi:hypothetical protein